MTDIHSYCDRYLDKAFNYTQIFHLALNLNY